MKERGGRTKAKGVHDGCLLIRKGVIWIVDRPSITLDRE